MTRSLFSSEATDTNGLLTLHQPSRRYTLDDLGELEGTMRQNYRCRGKSVCFSNEVPSSQKGVLKDHWTLLEEFTRHCLKSRVACALLSGSLESPIAKLKRAIEHYRILKFDFYGGVDRKRRPVMVERKRDGLEYCFRIGEIEPLDPAWPVVIGDAYYNLRAALDHLVYQLHVRHFRGRVPSGPLDDAEGDSAFPIWNDSGNVQQWRGIKRLGKRERAAIEYLQPYKGLGSNYPPEQRIWSLRWALSDINKINVVDKHRDLHLVRTAAQSVYSPRFEARYGYQNHPAFGQPLESNACVDTWTFMEVPPPKQIVEHPGIFTSVSIEVGGNRIAVVPHLGGCIICVTWILSSFESRFGSSLASSIDLSWIRETRD